VSISDACSITKCGLSSTSSDGKKIAVTGGNEDEFLSTLYSGAFVTAKAHSTLPRRCGQYTTSRLALRGGVKWSWEQSAFRLQLRQRLSAVRATRIFLYIIHSLIVYRSEQYLTGWSSRKCVTK